MNTRLIDNDDCCRIKRFFSKQISFYNRSADLSVAPSFTEIFCVPEVQTRTWPLTDPKFCLLTRWMLKNTPRKPTNSVYTTSFVVGLEG